METPEDMLGRLERMGESRVRNLIVSGHFAPRTMGLVKGWLLQKEQAREAREEDVSPQPSIEDAVARFEQLAREAVEVAEEAAKAAELASHAALLAHRLAIGGIVAGGVGLLAAILAMFAMTLR